VTEQAAVALNLYALRRHLTSLAGPCAFVLVLAMVVVPLPPFALDILFTFNISFALMILLASLYTAKPTDFSAFPTLLLLTTLLRLSLNIAAARVILLDGYLGSGAAGRVIESFGAFVVGGNYAVGIAVFAILVIINFVVITKGAGRIAEVAARFVLDGMPGKQMAIDADLNAGLINQEEATRRRRDVSHEADFFGAMDGASKFVRGDAVAAVLILSINLIGGFVIGIWQHGLSLGEAGQTYTLLTIGDGLVAQIPALIISSAAGIIVSRVSTGHDVGNEVMGQLAAFPKAWWLAAGIVGLFGIIPGMPHVPFLIFAPLLGAGGGGSGGNRDAKRSGRPRRRRSQRKPEKSILESSSSSSLWRFKSDIGWSASSVRSATAVCCGVCAPCAGNYLANLGFWFL
jgi:flagellar biosynthesis protein FlhA